MKRPFEFSLIVGLGERRQEVAIVRTFAETLEDAIRQTSRSVRFAPRDIGPHLPLIDIGEGDK